MRLFVLLVLSLSTSACVGVYCDFPKKTTSSKTSSEKVRLRQELQVKSASRRSFRLEARTRRQTIRTVTEVREQNVDFSSAFYSRVLRADYGGPTAYLLFPFNLVFDIIRPVTTTPWALLKAAIVGPFLGEETRTRNITKTQLVPWAKGTLTSKTKRWELGSQPKKGWSLTPTQLVERGLTRSVSLVDGSKRAPVKFPSVVVKGMNDAIRKGVSEKNPGIHDFLKQFPSKAPNIKPRAGESLASLIARAPSGARIQLEARSYRLDRPMTLNKTLLIRGGGRSRTSISVRCQGPGLIISGGQVVFERLSVTRSTEKGCLILVQSGSLGLNEIVLDKARKEEAIGVGIGALVSKASPGSALRVQGRQSHVIADHATFRDSAEGVRVEGGARFDGKYCNFSFNHSGVVFEPASRGRLAFCQVTGNKGAGVMLNKSPVELSAMTYKSNKGGDLIR